MDNIFMLYLSCHLMIFCFDFYKTKNHFHFYSHYQQLHGWNFTVVK